MKKIKKKVLISVSNKKDIVSFSKKLYQRKFEILASKKTYSLLKKENIPATKISKYIDFPEILQGRVKTIHPKIYAGILSSKIQDDEIMLKNNISSIDMVVVNLYPFADVIKNTNYSFQKIIEYIDIGGLSLIRAAAKNFRKVSIIIEKKDYDSVISALDKNKLTLKMRFMLALKAFKYTYQYDKKIFKYFDKKSPKKEKNNSVFFPKKLNINLKKKINLAYGENFHQKGAFYILDKKITGSISNLKQLQGKSISYNNISDANIALECVKEFKKPACVIVKHSIPCSVVVSNTILHSYQFAYKADPVSAFGGVIAFNRKLDVNTSKCIIKSQFVQLIIVPDISKSALKIFSTNSKIKILVCGYWKKIIQETLEYKSVNNGLLVQSSNIYHVLNKNDINIVSIRKPNQKMLNDAFFCWKVIKHVKSNAIVYGKNNATIGIGSGQTSRIYATKIASMKALENNPIKGACMASDAFLPFRDGVDIAAKSGIVCIIQPGGSIRDKEVIYAADQHNIVMIFTGIRYFSH